MKKKRLFFLLCIISLLEGHLFASDFTQGCILITEIMGDASGLTDLPKTKYIELYNASNSSIDLKNWLLHTDISMVLPETVLAAGQYAVLYEVGKTIHIDVGGLAVPLSAFPSNLTNIKIESPDGVEIDAVTCPTPLPARSWERDAEGNLYLSNDPRGGTPGLANSPKEPTPEIDDFQFGDIWINEIMVNPGNSSPLGNAEYIELYNTTSSAINLKNWSFIYHATETSNTVVTLPEVILPAGGYAVLYRATKNLTVDGGGIAIPVVNFPSTLANTGRLIEIKSPKNVLIDAVTYKNSSSFAGSSWERDADGNYYPSTDPRGGTPGAMNSIDSSLFGDIWINEIMVNPGSSLVFGEAEYVELYNTTSAAINLKNWSFIYHAGETSSTVVTLPEVILPAGGYAVLYRTGKSLTVDGGGIAIPVANFPSTLANAGRLLELKSTRNVLIDAVTYKNSSSFAGSSWERDGGGNFFPSTDPRGGTPGSVNSTDNSRANDIWINEIMVNPGSSLVFGEAEYIELYNTTNGTINLKGWSLIYHASETSSTVMILPEVILPSGGYAVVYRTSKNLTVDGGGIAIPVTNFPSTLANAGRLLEVRNTRNVLIDAVTYPNSSSLQGCSWERDMTGNYFPSADLRGGTPGSMNSTDNTRFGNVWINEIMVIPSGSAISETEYVELYNASSFEINLKGWTFIYDSRTVVTLPSVILPAGGYAVLYRADRNISIDTGGIPVPLSNFPSSLANTGRLLEIKNTRDILIDSVTYKNSTNIAGCSWERDWGGNFYPSNDLRGGTPGAVNSLDNSRLGNVWINEIMVNPRGADLPETEYVELYNTSTSAVNLRGWTLIYDSRTVVTLPGTILPAGGYAVLYREGKEIQINQGGIAIPVANFPSTLANAGRNLELKNSKEILIDSATYKNSTNFAGRSWERDNEGDYYLSNDTRGGTPGSINSPKDIPKGPDYSQYGDVLINEVMADPRGLTALPETEYIEFYNATEVNINLKGWTFIYDERINIDLPDIVLPVNRYAVLYRAGKEIHIDEGGIAMPVANFPSTLANAGRKLELTNSLNVLIDSITYKAAKSAQSWERDLAGSYYLSTNPRGGTPGSVNSPKEPVIEPDDAKYGDVRINEIMANPIGSTAFPETEYVELHNASDASINLKNWTFIYDHRVEVVLPEVILPVDGYAVLYRTGKEIHIDDGGIAIPLPTFPATLANTGRYLGITNQKGALIDSISYPTALQAWAWERDPDGNLYLSYNPRGGTPGSVNSIRSNPEDPNEESLFVSEKEWIFNELLPEEYVGGSEYIELYNRSNRTLFLSGLSIATRRTDGTLGTRYSLSSIKESFLPGTYIVLTTDRTGVLNYYYTSTPHHIYEQRMPSLNNTESTLVLFRTTDEIIVDEVHYSSKWHDPFIRNLKGVALERINSEADTQNPTNWTSATSEVGYGTPGYQNSQNRGSDAEKAMHIGIPEYMDGYGYYSIPYRLDKNGYHCRMEVYSIEGKKVADISNNQLLGFEGELRWDGYGIDGSRLRVGLYVFYAELYHPEGQRKSFKNAFLVKP